MMLAEEEMKASPFDVGLRSLEQLMEVFIARYYRNKGYLILTEKRFGKKGIQRCDIVAIRPDEENIPNSIDDLHNRANLECLFRSREVELIELKSHLGNWLRGLHQCTGYCLDSDKVYIAFPGIMEKKIDCTHFKELGIGIYFVYSDGIKIVNGNKATDFGEVLRYFNDQELEYLKNWYNLKLEGNKDEVIHTIAKKGRNYFLKKAYGKLRYSIPGIFYDKNDVFIDNVTFLFGRLSEFEREVLGNWIEYQNEKRGQLRSLRDVLDSCSSVEELNSMIDDALRCPEFGLANALHSLGRLHQ